MIRGALSPFDSQATKTVSAECPAGKRVIGGAGRINGSSRVVLTRLQPEHTPSGDRYSVSANEDQVGESGTWAVQATVICADPAPGLEIVSRSAPTGSDSNVSVDAICFNKIAVGGGGQIIGGNGQVNLGTTTDDNPSFRAGASASEDRDGFAGNWTLTAYAVCVTPPGIPIDFSQFATVRVTTPPSPDSSKIVDAFCPPGMRLTGGAGQSSGGVVTVISPDALAGGIPGNRVRVLARDKGTGLPWDATAYAFCAR